jgi:hypothetical protein
MNELTKAKTKTVTQKLVGEITDRLKQESLTTFGKYHEDLEAAREWWDIWGHAIVDVDIEEIRICLKERQGEPYKSNLSSHYEILVERMTFEEKMEFLEDAVEDLVYSNSEKIRQAAFIWALIAVSKDLLPIILTVL